MKLIFGLLLAFACAISGAQTRDGNWLVKNIRLVERVQQKQSTTEDEFRESMQMLFYCYGYVEALYFPGILAEVAIKIARDNPTPANRERARLAAGMTPLRAVPALPTQQLVAVLKKYLDAHPERWGEPASKLVASALSEAFPAPPPE